MLRTASHAACFSGLMSRKTSTLNNISSIMIFEGLRKELGVPAIIIYNRGSQELVASSVMK